MKKQIIAAVSLVVLVGAAVAGMYFLNGYAPPLPETAPTPETGVTIFSTDKDKLVRIEKLLPNESYAMEKSGESWSVASNAGVKLSKSKVDNLTYGFASVFAGDTATEAVQSLELYGLAQPSGVIRITSESGETAAFTVGNPVPDGTGYYVMSVNAPNPAAVYILGKSIVNDWLAPLGDIRETEIFSVAKEDITQIGIRPFGKPALEAIRANSEPVGESEKLAAQYGYFSEWKFISPIEKAANSEFDAKVLTPVLGLKILAFTDKTDISACGLDKPDVLAFSAKDGTFVTMKFGREEDGVTYAQIGENSEIVTISSSSLGFMNVDLMGIMDKTLLLPDITTVREVSIRTANAEYLLSIEGDVKNNAAVYRLGGAEKGKEDFKKLYQAVIGQTIVGFVDGKTSGVAPDITITYRYNGERPEDTVSFAPDSGGRLYLAAVNGAWKYRVDAQDITTLQNALTSRS